MDEISRYAVGVDVGTENVRAVVASIDKNSEISVIGYNEDKNAGMRKGVVANLAGPSGAIDRMLGEVERMSGYEVNAAVVGVNGSHILTTRVEGMIAAGTLEHEVNNDDLTRVEEVAAVGRIPANREILELVPLSYVLDGQTAVKNPLGMNGSRLEMQANVISALLPNCDNLRRATHDAGVEALSLVPTAVAAARAVLSERQMENGVALVDMGAATTSVAIFEEGDLQYVGVVPVGAHNITNDLAIVLQIDIEVAEEIKRRFVTGSFDGQKDIVIKHGREELSFNRAEVDEVVRARLAEIFDQVRKEFKKAGYDRRLPEGVVLTGGGARMKDIEVYAKDALEAAVKIGIPKSLGGVADAVAKPDYAAAVGLMLFAAEENFEPRQGKKQGKNSEKKSSGLFSIFKKIKF